MAYNAATGNNAQLLKRTVTGLTDFSGRSRRTEVIYYLIASGLVGAVLEFAITTVVQFEASLFASSVLQVVLTAPVFSLFVRRLHDQNRSGWWGLLLPLSVSLRLPEVLSRFSGNIADMIAQKATPMGIAASLCTLAVFILCLLPGTEGSNRYGPAPRLEGV